MMTKELIHRVVLIAALSIGVVLNMWRRGGGVSTVGVCVLLVLMVLVYESRDTVDRWSVNARAMEYLERKARRELPYLRDSDASVIEALWTLRCVRGFGKREFMDMVENVEDFARICANVTKGRFDAVSHVGFMEQLEEEWSQRVDGLLVRLPARSRFARAWVRAGESLHEPIINEGAVVRGWMIDCIKRVKRTLQRTRHHVA